MKTKGGDSVYFFSLNFYIIVHLYLIGAELSRMPSSGHEECMSENKNQFLIV